MGLIVCEILLGCLVFFAGSCVFSFLNVIVYRVPRNQSFIKGRSACPACGHGLRAADLIPVLSFMALRGTCRYCGSRIPVRDTLVEALGGILALVTAYYYGMDIKEALTVFLFFCILTVTALLDLDTMEIADGCQLAAAAVAVLSVFTMPGVTIPQRLIGFFCVSVPFLLVTLAVPGAFGGGDIKLMAVCGLFLGWKITLVSTAAAILLGGSYGAYLLAAKKKGRKDHFAFGPFLCIGMAAGLLYGQQIIDWYMGFLIY